MDRDGRGGGGRGGFLRSTNQFLACQASVSLLADDNVVIDEVIIIIIRGPDE